VIPCSFPSFGVLISDEAPVGIFTAEAAERLAMTTRKGEGDPFEAAAMVRWQCVSHWKKNIPSGNLT